MDVIFLDGSDFFLYLIPNRISVFCTPLVADAVDDAEIEEEELDGVVDDAAEQEFSLNEFVLR